MINFEKTLSNFGYRPEDISSGSNKLLALICDYCGADVFHRMKFLGNSGYEAGMYKIWDCGQAKYIRQL